MLCLICVAGIFYEHFRENYFQFFGLCGIAFYAASRFWRISQLDEISPQQTFYHLSFLAFALGTAYKTIKFAKDHPKRPKSRPPSPQQTAKHENSPLSPSRFS